MTTRNMRDVALKTAFDATKHHIEERHGIPVILTHVLDPNTGDFDGAEIKVDPENDLDVALFVLAHLFGHTVQWTTDEHLRELGLAYATSAPPAELLDEVRLYERDASRLALQLFHDAEVSGFDQWLSDWAAADWGFLEHFYRTGERLDFRRFLKGGTPLLEPLPIPSFTPTRWCSRYSF